MTALCLKSKNLTKTEAWSSVFSAFNTETRSCFFMKQLTNTCISTILYLRKILPEEYFETKNFEGMDLKILKFGNCYTYLDKIESWLDGAFDAIDKKYLKHLMLDIKDTHSAMTLEIYTMTFQYQTEKDEPNILLSSAGAIKERDSTSASSTQLKTIRLLQMCYAITQSSSSLPPQVTLAIRLSYHEDVPEDYHPIGYKAWEPSKPVFPKETRTIEMGVTETSHHFFKLISKSCFNESFFKEVDENQNNRTSSAKRGLCFDENTQTEDAAGGEIIENRKNHVEKKLKDSITENNKNQNVLSQVLDNTNVPEMSQNSASQSTGINTLESSSIEPEGQLEKVRCPCLSPKKFSIMFLCSGCKYWVHAECFGVLEFDFSKKIRFHCHLCHKEDGVPKCHDKVMIRLKNPDDQQKVAFLRRVLKFCNLPSVTEITLRKMEKMAGSHVSQKSVEIILKKIIDIGVAVPKGKNKSFKIDKQKLSERLDHYFYPLHYLNGTLSRLATLSMRTPEMMKRKVMDFSDPYNSAKHRKSKVAEQIFGTYTKTEENSQKSSDLFRG